MTKHYLDLLNKYIPKGVLVRLKKHLKQKEDSNCKEKTSKQLIKTCESTSTKSFRFFPNQHFSSKKLDVRLWLFSALLPRNPGHHATKKSLNLPSSSSNQTSHHPKSQTSNTLIPSKTPMPRNKKNKNNTNTTQYQI